MRRLGAGVALLALAVAPAAAQQITAEQIAEAVGLSGSDIKKVQAGEIVSTDVESSSDKELAVGLVLVVPAALDQIVDSVSKGTTIEANKAILAHGSIDASQIGDAAFAGVELDDSEIDELLDASPSDDFNLSAEEWAVFEALGDQYDSGDEGAADAVNSAYRQMLAGRMQAYVDKGLDGIAPYDRGGDTSSAAEDLRNAAEAATVLKEFAPEGYQALVGYPAAGGDFSHEFHWTKQLADDRPVIILTHRMTQQKPDVYLIMSRDFYVGHSFNSSQALAGVLPVESGSAVFYGNRTATDQVAGFGSGMKRSIGAGMMSDTLVETLEEARKTLQ